MFLNVCWAWHSSMTSMPKAAAATASVLEPGPKSMVSADSDINTFNNSTMQMYGTCSPMEHSIITYSITSVQSSQENLTARVKNWSLWTWSQAVLLRSVAQSLAQSNASSNALADLPSNLNNDISAVVICGHDMHGSKLTVEAPNCTISHPQHNNWTNNMNKSGYRFYRL